MSDGWAEVALGEVFKLKNAKLGPYRDEPLVFAISKYDGVIPAKEFFSKRIASANLDGYKILDPEDWVYSTIHIDEGSIACNSTGYSGVVSPMYTTMSWDTEQHLPAYFKLLLRSREALQLYASHAQGTVNRRRSLPFRSFEALRFVVPPLQSQNRIVDLIESVDSYIKTLRVQDDAARTARTSLLQELLYADDDDWTDAVLSDLLRRSIGGVWGSEKGSEEVDVTVVRSTEFTSSGYLNFATGVRRSCTARQLASRELQEGDILLEKSGGGPKQPVGRVVYVTDEIPNDTVCANFIQLVSPDPEAVCPEFVFLLMWLWHSEGRTLGYQAQTTGIRNLRTKDYLAQTIRLPPRAAQERIVDIASAVEDLATASKEAIAATTRLRNGLLSELLSGDHEIPESYDALLEAS